MKIIIDSVTGIFDSYPWLGFLALCLVWIGGTIWEYQTHRNRQVTLGWLFLFLAVLIYMVSSAEQLGVVRWGLDFVIFTLAMIGINKFSKYSANWEKQKSMVDRQ